MSQAKIYVGNLSYSTTNNDIQNHFEQYGSIVDIKLITDRETGRSKGFAFVTFETPDAAQNALQADGQDMSGRNLKVSIAREQQRRSGGGDRGDGRGY